MIGHPVAIVVASESEAIQRGWIASSLSLAAMTARLIIRDVLVWLMTRVIERDQVAALVLGRRHYDQLVGALELLDVVAFHMLELCREDARLRPFAAFAELHVTDQRMERRGVNVGAEFIAGRALGGRDRLA